MKCSRLIASGLVAAFALSTVSESALACTRVFWNTNKQAKIVARTMDLFMSDQARIVASPRGVERVSDTGSGKPLKWVARYGSVAVTALGVATSDGLNEKGVSVNLLYLDKTTYEPRDERPGLSNAQWSQYVLDNFATVTEALEGLKSVQIVSVKAAGQEWPLHVSIADATGDSAVIEFINGKMVVHHGSEFTVMTNEPALDTQLANLKRYRTFGGKEAMPGDIDPASRFVRASSYLKMLDEPQDLRQAVAGAYSIARNTAVPPGAKDTSGQENVADTWSTLWTTIADVTNKTYYFQSTRSPSMYWVDLTKIDFKEGAPVLSVDAYGAGLDGDISARLMK
jgi:penicillin V acylase-like amidase (Ntn superfamily)